MNCGGEDDEGSENDLFQDNVLDMRQTVTVADPERLSTALRLEKKIFKQKNKA